MSFAGEQSAAGETIEDVEGKKTELNERSDTAQIGYRVDIDEQDKCALAVRAAVKDRLIA